MCVCLCVSIYYEKNKNINEEIQLFIHSFIYSMCVKEFFVCCCFCSWYFYFYYYYIVFGCVWFYSFNISKQMKWLVYIVLISFLRKLIDSFAVYDAFYYAQIKMSIVLTIQVKIEQEKCNDVVKCVLDGNGVRHACE